MADKRLTPARPDLAASSLKGQVAAARFVDGEEAAVAWGRVSLRAGSSYDSGQVSELLFGEIVTIYERKDGWAWLQAKTDSYVGYARESGLGPAFEADAHVIQLLTPLLSAPDVKSPLRDMLPLNARVKRGREEGNFVAVADKKPSATATKFPSSRPRLTRALSGNISRNGDFTSGADSSGVRSWITCASASKAGPNPLSRA